MLKRRVYLFLRLLLGLSLFGITFYLVDWRAVYTILSTSRPDWIAAAGLATLLTLGLKLARWGSLLRGYGIHFSWIVLGRAFFSGQAANILLPVRGGEAVRLGIAMADDAQQWSLVAASISLEKILDFFSLLLLTLWVSNHAPGNALLGHNSIPWINAAILLLLISLYPLWKLSRPILLRSTSKTAARLAAAIERIAEYLHWILRPRRLLAFSTLTVLIWALMLLINICILRAVSLPADVQASAAVLVLIYLGIAPALMPGNLGPFLVLAGLGLSAYGYSPGPAFAFAVLLHLIVTMPPLVLSAGFYLFDRRR